MGIIASMAASLAAMRTPPPPSSFEFRLHKAEVARLVALTPRVFRRILYTLFRASFARRGG